MSPFPGMNPYFEQPGIWRGFHTLFLVYALEEIAASLPKGYQIDIEESLFIDTPEDGARLFAVADLAVQANDSFERDATAVMAAPLTTTIRMPRQRRARNLMISSRIRREVVTVIELLSPANKSLGADRNLYLNKRATLLQNEANYVEWDLLRGGERLPVEDLPACDYYALVSRRSERPRVGVWPILLRDPLPVVPIPLLPGDPEPLVNLKRIVDRVYDVGMYGQKLYGEDPTPPLAPDDAAWAAAIIATQIAP